MARTGCFKVSPNRIQTYHVRVTSLPAANFSWCSGYQQLKDFLDGITNWMERTFDFTHTDGLTIPVRLVLESWQFTEVYKDRYDGMFDLERVH